VVAVVVVGAGAIIAVAVASSIVRVTSHGVTEGREKGGKAKGSEGLISGGRVSERVPVAFIGARN
jgi:hypothetical protein